MQVTTKSALPEVQSTKNFAKAVKQPTSDFKHQQVPWHPQAVLNASDAVLEPPRAIVKVVTTNVAKATTAVGKVTTAANSFSPAAPSAVIKVNMINS